MKPSAILREAKHRPYPLPRGPWVMRQTWLELLFAHWPLPPESLRPLIPAELALDTYDGRAWLGIAPFRMVDVRLRLAPSVPWLSAFPELNVRTYVTVGGKPGVYFFSLDAGNPIAVTLARALFYLPYFNARFAIKRSGDTIAYTSRRDDRRGRPADLVASYRPIGPVFCSQPGSLEAFLTERYCLYSVGPRGTIYRGEIHHEQWPLQPAEAEFERNTMAEAAGITLPDAPPLLHYAERLEVLIWPITSAHQSSADAPPGGLTDPGSLR
jgi:uncharacterized protein YqjF (DUF2071 family)